MEEGEGSLKTVLCRMNDIGAICFGDFTLKSGIRSPIYIDMRITMCEPGLLMKIAGLLWKAAEDDGTSADVVCGVPTGGIPLATCVSVYSNLPMVFCRKEIKDYGRKRPVEGKYHTGQKCVLVEDVFVSGQSTMETAEMLQESEFKVTDALVFLDRQQGGKSILEKEGINVHSVITMTEMLHILYECQKINKDVRDECIAFIKANQLTTLPRHLKTAKKPPKLGYRQRAQLCNHPLTRRLFNIMADKQTNLALSVDVGSCSELLKIADELGPYVCLLKTHVDMLADFHLDRMADLQALAEKHSFLIFEDRKFADIGNTVHLQYTGGTYRIADWAHVINAHPIPGPGVVQGLRKAGADKGRALVLVAEMSSIDHLCSADYVKKTVDIANRNRDFVIGFICQSYLTSNPEMIHMVPGVRLEKGTDGLGQGYMTPADAFSRGADLIIVGRGILQAKNPIEASKQYQQAGHDAYMAMVDPKAE